MAEAAAATRALRRPVLRPRAGSSWAPLLTSAADVSALAWHLKDRPCWEGVGEGQSQGVTRAAEGAQKPLRGGA